MPTTSSDSDTYVINDQRVFSYDSGTGVLKVHPSLFNQRAIENIVKEIAANPKGCDFELPLPHGLRCITGIRQISYLSLEERTANP